MAKIVGVRERVAMGAAMPVEPPGVPTPYKVHVHPYPTRFHGGNWTRPSFGFPAIRRGYSVSMPHNFSPAPGPDLPQVAGLGAVETHDGIYRRPASGGGGIFNSTTAGLGQSVTWEQSATQEAFGDRLAQAAVEAMRRQAIEPEKVPGLLPSTAMLPADGDAPVEPATEAPASGGLSSRTALLAGGAIIGVAVAIFVATSRGGRRRA